jgi:hypothetical protein
LSSSSICTYDTDDGIVTVGSIDMHAMSDGGLLFERPMVSIASLFAQVR